MTLDASSVFDAADQALEGWARLWWSDSAGSLSAGRTWSSVSTAGGGRSSQELARFEGSGRPAINQKAEREASGYSFRIAAATNCSANP